MKKIEIHKFRIDDDLFNSNWGMSTNDTDPLIVVHSILDHIEWRFKFIKYQDMKQIRNFKIDETLLNSKWNGLVYESDQFFDLHSKFHVQLRFKFIKY